VTPLLVGIVLALAAGLFGTVVGLDRERSFYTTIMVVIAFLYALFAVLGGTTRSLVLEILAGTAFCALAVLGFRGSLWLVVVALCGHGVFDLVHGRLIADAGVPPYWPAFCSAYDIVAGGYLAWLIASRRVPAAR
jgi:hypothetical protein